MIDRLIDCESSFFLDGKILYSAPSIFSILKRHSCPFISPQLCTSRVRLMFFPLCVEHIPKLRKEVQVADPSLSRKHQALSSAAFSNKNNNGKLYFWGYNRHSIQIIRLLLTPEQNLTHVNLFNGFNKSRANQRRHSISEHPFFFFFLHFGHAQ